MFLREWDGTTLATLGDDPAFTKAPFYWGGGTHQVTVHLEDETPTIRFGEHEVPATVDGIAAVSSFFDVPSKFVQRIQPDEQQFVLTHRIERSSERNISIAWTSDGVREIIPADSVRLDLSDFYDIACDVMDAETTMVRDFVWDGSTYLLDIVSDVDQTAKYVGGDREVGDITSGGLRFFQDRKRNLAPGVQPLLYRLRCTNGMEIADASIKVDARGADIMEITDRLKVEARTALSRIDRSIEAFYDLRNQPVGDDRTGVLHRLARENDLPTRTAQSLEDALPGYLLDDFNIESANEVTMFHLVNLITNGANSESLSLPQSRRLERVGGDILNDHISRCSFCHARLS